MHDTAEHATGRVSVRTLAELADHLTDERGDTRIIAPETGRELAHRQIPALARGVTSWLLDHEVRPGDVVGLLIGAVPEFFVAAFGAWQAGCAITVLPTPPIPTPADTVARSLTRLLDQVDCVLVADALLPVAQQVSAMHPRLKILRYADCPADGALYKDALPRPESPAVVQFTSGSTARPKGVVLSHRAVLACQTSTRLAGATSSRDVYASWVPLFHDFGLITAIHTLWLGAEHHLFTAWHFIKRPRDYVEYLGRHRVTISGGPNFGYERMIEACTNGLPEGLDLSAMRMFLNGGEPVKPATVDRLQEVFGPAGLSDTAMTPVYGMAEVTMSATCSPLDRPPVCTWFDRDALIGERRAVPAAPATPGGVGLVAVGSVVPGLELELRTEDGRIAANGEVGEIHLRGDAVASGYLNDAAASADTFQHGWLRTGDLGVQVDDLLYIAGRRKDMIIVAGRNFFAEDVEDVVRAAHPAAEACVAFADTERERLVVVAEIADLATAEKVSVELRARVSGVLGLGELDVFAVPRNSLPRTTSGKWQRQLTAKFVRTLTTGQV